MKVTSVQLFSGFEFIHVYIDYLLILTKGDWIDHKKRNLCLKNGKKEGFDVISKSIYLEKLKWDIYVFG